MKTCSIHDTCAVPAAVVAALVLALTGGAASANGTVTAPLVDYNSAQVLLANGDVTVPFGSTLADAIYTVTAAAGLETGSFFTITLPTGFLFQSNPMVIASSAGTSVTPNSGGVGNNSITYVIGTAAVPDGGTLSVETFNVSGATALESQYGGNSLPMTFQATSDSGPVSVPVFAHAVGSLPDTITPGSGQINVLSLPPATQFVPNGATVAGSGLVADFAINTEMNDPFNSNAPVLSPNGTANSLSTSDTANITVEGPFDGIGAAYADPAVTTCAATVPGGAITGTVTNTSLTFNGVPINTPEQICMIPNGVTVLQAGTQPYVYTYSAGAGSTDYFGGLSQTTAGNFYTYSGSVVQEILYTTTAGGGNFSNYYSYPGRQMYVRIVNDEPAAATVMTEVKSDTGATGYTTIAVPANNNVLVPVSQIVKDSGVVLGSNHSGGSASMIFVAASPVKIEQLEVDANGDIVQLGSGSSP